MAKRPKKTIDPTEAALSATEAALAAIQEDLNSHDEEEENTEIGPPRIAPEDRPRFAPTRKAIDRFASAGRDASNLHARDLRAQVTRPANDDQQSVGQILRALQRRPAQTSYVVAATCSGAWLIGCFALSWAYLSNLNAALGPNHSSAAVMLGLGALALLPIIFFFGVAHMAARAQELRLIAQAMAGVAMRLAEPEAVAQDAIVSVGQAIRREVAAMGDGVERTLVRASELEAMVHNEVAALARAYDENEARISGLMEDLGTQRDTLVSQAEQVRSAINNVHIDLTQDLSTISELVEQQVNDATQRITTSLGEKGEHITLSLSQIGDNMIDQLSARGGDLLERLETVRAETTRAIAAASDRLNASLGFKTDHIGAEFAEIAQGLDDMLTARLDRVTEHFSEKSLAVVDTMVARSQELTDLVNGRAREFTGSIIETSSQIAGQIAASTEQVSNTLKASGESLLLDLNLRGGEIATKLEETGGRITGSLVSRTNKMTDSVRESAEHLVSIITSRSDAVKELLATRLAVYEEKLSHSGVELGEKISRNASTLGSLITRHLTEFDHTVKSYGAELVDRLGARTQEISDSMRGQIENFDSKLGARANEVTTSFDERFSRFHETFDGRTRTLTEALSTRVLDLTKTLTEGGKGLVDAIDSRGQQFAASVSERLAVIERTLGVGATEVANTLDERIERLEKLLLGRTQALIAEMDTHSRAAADMLNARLVELSDSIKTNSTAAEQTLSALVANTTEALGKTAAASSAATEALNRSATGATAILEQSANAIGSTLDKSTTEAAAMLSRSTGALSGMIDKSAAEAAALLDRSATGATAILEQSANAISSTLDKSTTEAAAMLSRSTGALSGMIDKSAAEAAALLDRSAGALSTTISESAAAASDAIEKSTAASSAALDKSTASTAEVIGRTAAMAGETIGKTAATATDLLVKTASESSEAISRSANGADQMLSRINSEIVRNVGERAERIEAILSQHVSEMTRALDDKSAEMTRMLDQRSTEMTRALDEQSTQISRTLAEKSGDVLNAFSDKGEQFSGEITRVTDQAVKAIEAKGFIFTQTMMDNSEEIARLINEAAQKATAAVTRTLGTFQDGTQGVTEAAKTSITQTLETLHGATGTAIEESKKTAAATVAEILDTHGRLRSDSTALFERLREANTLLQEVLGGAHENMTAIERMMASRVSEFVAAMNELNSKSGTATAKLEEHLGAFNTTTVKVLSDLGALAAQFTSHGRALAEAAELLERSNRHTEDTVASRHTTIEALVAKLDTRTDDFEQRLRRFSSLLDGSLDSAIVRAQEIAGIVAETSNESVQAIEQQFDVVRASADEQGRRTSETLSAAYDATFGKAQAMFSQSAERFAEIMQGMKQMAGQMQRELEATRAELRRGALELPQETAENAAQMRRVIVEQMEALAELNRIVARHGGALDAVVSGRRDAEAAYAAGGTRPQPRPSHPETGAPTRPIRESGAPPRRPDSPSLSPVKGGKDAGNGRGGGWLSQLLTRASRDDGQSAASSPSGESTGSLEALSVDIARMIDHEATVEFWDRYQRGESGLGGRHLYTAQGQKTFDEIRRKYRSDPEFRETVQHYIDEFEQLLQDVSRGESGHTVARNYLASDTGKVYTMLAHAAGRFEQ